MTQVVNSLSNDEFINSAIEQLLAYQESENVNLPLLEKQLSKVNTSINNMLNAITEPKCKFYYCVFSESEKAANDKLLKFKRVFEFTPE